MDILHNAGIWAIIDWAIMIALVVKLGGPAIAKVFSNKRESIAQAVATAESTLAEAQKVLDEQKRTQADAAKILADVATSAKSLAATLVADVERETQAEVARAKEAAKAEIDRERQAMLGGVRAEILAAAFTEAERAIRESLNNTRQTELFSAFAAKAGEVRP